MDAVAQVTSVPEHFPDSPSGTRAVQLISTRTPAYALDVLGRCSRERSCDGPSRTGGGLAQALHLINGSTINAKLRGGIIEQLLARQLPDRELIDELYVRAFTRSPASEEWAEWESLLTRTPDKTEAVQDLLWALLNSREFAFNH